MFVKGKPKPPNSGRKKGQPTRLQAEVRVRCEELGLDPIEAMVELATDTKTPVEIRAKLLMAIAEYIYPKRARTELTGPGGGPIEFTGVSPKEILESRFEVISKRLRDQGAAA